MDNKTEPDVPEEPEPVFNIPVLWILKNAQQEHGLRHRDFQRYRQFITRKIRRMRKVIDFRQGNRAKVIPKDMAKLEIADPRFITLRLFEIERCWAFAMQLKEESQDEPRKRFHARGKMRKAVSLAESISQFLDSYKFEATSRLELQAYVHWIKSVLHFELHNWHAAKEHLEAAHLIYTGLSKHSDDDSRELYLNRCEEISPQIRYCAYNIGDKKAATDLRKIIVDDSARNPDLEQLIDQARTKEAEKVTEVVWMKEKIPVKLEQARLAVLSMQEFDAEICSVKNTQTGLAMYESVLKTCVTSIAAVRDAMKTMETAQSQAVGSSTGDAANIAASKRQAQASMGTVSAEKMSRTQLLLSYLQFSKLEKMVGRGLLQVKAALDASKEKLPGSVKMDILATSEYPKAQELARLYDSIVQNLNEILSLPGLIQDSHEFISALNSCILCYKAFRCYYLALAYCQNQKFQECLALLSRAAKYAQTGGHELKEIAGTKNLTNFGGVKFEDLGKHLKLLEAHIVEENLTCKAQKMQFLARGNKNSDEKREGAVLEKPLIEMLDRFLDKETMEKKLVSSLSGQPLVSLPPSYVPVPVKTSFFDLAFNQVEYPSYQERMRKTVEQSVESNPQQAQAGGISGFVKGWIWGGGANK